MDFTIQLADKLIHIESIYPEMKTFCKDYLTEDTTPDFSVHWTEEDIQNEQDLSSDLAAYTPQYLETLAALRKISEKMPLYHRMLMHGAAITYRDDAYLFTAPSGIGKSTHIKLWRKYLHDDVDIVNGDKPILSVDTPSRSEADSLDPKSISIRVHGTPWAGKEHWQKNRNAELKGICFLKQSTHNTIQRLQPADFLPALMKQVYIPSDTIAAGFTLDMLDVILTHVPLYLLNCDISEEAVRCSFEALTGEAYPIH